MSQKQITINYDIDFGFTEAEKAFEMQYPVAPTKAYAQQRGEVGAFSLGDVGGGNFSELVFDDQQLAENTGDLETWLQSASTESLDSVIAKMNGFQEDLGQFTHVVSDNSQVPSREGNQQENVVDVHAAQMQSMGHWPQQTPPYQALNMPPPPPLSCPIPAFDVSLDPQQGANENYRPVHLEQKEAQSSNTLPPPPPQQQQQQQQASPPDTERHVNPYGLTFGNLVQAEASMSQRHIEKNWRAPEDDVTIPTTDNERAAYVFDLLEAMKDTSRCQDRSGAPSFQNRWVPGAMFKPLPEQMEKVCWKIVDVAEKIHIHGPTSLSIYDPQSLALVFKSRLLTFKQRIEHTCELMRLSKARCFHMLKGENIETTVGSPVQRINGTKVNNDQNGKRQQIMEEGRPLWKKKYNEAGGTSQNLAEDNEEEDVKGSDGSDDVGIVFAGNAVVHDPRANVQYGDPSLRPHQAPDNIRTGQVVGTSNWASGINRNQTSNGNTGYAQPTAALKHAPSNLVPEYNFQQASAAFDAHFYNLAQHEPLYNLAHQKRFQQMMPMHSPHGLASRYSSKKRTADDAHIDVEVPPPARRPRYTMPRRVPNKQNQVNLGNPANGN